VLQFRPTDGLTATIDYTYSRNTVQTRNSNVGVWFNHEDTSSAWTDGPVAGPIFYTERFGPPGPGCAAPSPPPPNQCAIGKDLSYSGALTETRAENKSLGFNVEWEGSDGVSFELDAHHSTATVKPVNDYGSSISVGNAVFGVANQTINFENDLPVISYNMHPGIDPLNAALITPTGNAFRNAYFRDEINQVQLRGRCPMSRTRCVRPSVRSRTTPGAVRVRRRIFPTTSSSSKPFPTNSRVWRSRG
jgi:hypothetical protein